MSDFITSLQEARAGLWERAKEIMDRAAEEKRDLTAEEDTNLAAIDADLTALDARIKQTQERFAAAEAAEAIRVRVAPILRTSDRKVDEEIVRTVLRDGGVDVYPTMDHRALTTSTNTVAASFYDQVAVTQFTYNPTFELATVIRTGNGEPLTIPTQTADPTVALLAQGSAITPSDPTFSSVVLNAYALKAITLWSREFGEDNAINADALVARALGRSLGLTAGSYFTLGTNTTMPNGFITSGTVGATATGSPFFAADDILGLPFVLAAPYRQEGAWQMSNSAIAKVRKFKDTAGNYLYAVNVGQPDTFMGYRVYVNPHIAAVASASLSVAFADWKSAYYIREVTPMRVERSNDAYFSYDQTAIKAVWRVDGEIVDASALTVLKSANT